MAETADIKLGFQGSTEQSGGIDHQHQVTGNTAIPGVELLAGNSLDEFRGQRFKRAVRLRAKA